MVLVVKHLLANAGYTRYVGLILGWGRSPGGGHGIPVFHGISSILVWKIPWTDKPGRLQSIGSHSQT